MTATPPADFTPAVSHNVVRSAPDTNDVMGELSSVAQFISAALYDKRAREELARALKSPAATPYGLNLANCESEPTIAMLMMSGERWGAGSGRNICAKLVALGGVILYMNPGLLQRWDGSALPIVGAIEDPARPLPTTFKAYRSPNRMIDLPADGSVGGPVLMVLAMPHPSQPLAAVRSPRSIGVGASARASTAPSP